MDHPEKKIKRLQVPPEEGWKPQCQKHCKYENNQNKESIWINYVQFQFLIKISDKTFYSIFILSKKYIFICIYTCRFFIYIKRGWAFVCVQRKEREG